jgi:hypothetical protein
MANTKASTKSNDQQSSQPGAAGDFVGVSIALWDSPGNAFTGQNAKARVGSGCQDDSQSCWQPINSDSPLTAPANKIVQIEAQAELSGEPAHFYPFIGKFDCEKNSRINMYRVPAKEALTRGNTVELVVKAHLCNGRDDHRDQNRPARIAWATAQDQSVGKPDSGTQPGRQRPVTAAILDHVALFNVQSDHQYLIEVRLEDRCATTCPSSFSVPGSIGELSICAQPRERVVTLLFVDGCGKPVDPSDVLIDERGSVQKLPAGLGGTYTLTGVEAGSLRFLSSVYDLRPREIHVDERMNQAHVVEAICTVPAANSREADKIFLQIDQEIGEGLRAFFEVLTLEGKLLKTLDAENGKAVFHATDDQPCMIKALVGNTVVGETMHHPKRLSQGSSASTKQA